MPSRRSGKVHKNQLYSNMRTLALVVTITQISVLVAASAYKIAGGMPWYNFMPVLVIEPFNLFCVYQFLLYRHPKEQTNIIGVDAIIELGTLNHPDM